MQKNCYLIHFYAICTIYRQKNFSQQQSHRVDLHEPQQMSKVPVWLVAAFHNSLAHQKQKKIVGKSWLKNLRRFCAPLVLEIDEKCAENLKIVWRMKQSEILRLIPKQQLKNAVKKWLKQLRNSSVGLGNSFRCSQHFLWFCFHPRN